MTPETKSLVGASAPQSLEQEAPLLSDVDNLVRLVGRARRLWPERVAWVFDVTNRQLTFADIDEQSTRIALALLFWRIKP